MTIHWKQLDTPSKIEAIKTVWEKGLSAKAIASYFDGATKGSIIGMYNRHGAHLADHPLNKPMKQEGDKARAKARKRPARVKLDLPALAENPTEYDAKARRIPLMELKARECKFPLGDPRDADFGFCGHAVEFGSFCDHHAARVYRAA